MSTTIEFGGVSYDVPPFMLAELEAAAPHIDLLNELGPEFQQAIRDKKPLPLTKQFKLLRAQVGVLAVGIGLVDPEMTADKIMKQVNFTFIPSLGDAVNKLVASAGIQTAGEEKAPTPARGKGAKASKAR